MDRRTTLQWMLAAAASAPLLKHAALADIPSAAPPKPPGKGYGGDPDLNRIYKIGELWPLTFTQAQRRTAAALADLILPADFVSPGASTVGVVDFIDEWISAPYQPFRADRTAILEGLAWLDAESRRRFATDFASLEEQRMRTICDGICLLPKQKERQQPAAKFFSRYRDLTTGGFYTTPQGRADLKFVGNVPRPGWDGPPPEVLKQVGLK